MLGNQHRAVLTLCAAAPILVAMAVSASYQPTSSPSSSPEGSTSMAPGVSSTENQYDCPTSYDDDEEDPVLLLMDSSSTGDGSYSFGSTYDEEVQVATVFNETCEWNTVMCCWTGYDGQESMYGNTDVCRVLDYPDEGDSLELPRDDEGTVYCHGFGWSDGADVRSNILPLYHHVKNANRTEDGGFYGNVEGAPECGCIEDMPIVSDAACTKFGINGLQQCYLNSLRKHYKGKLEKPNGDMHFNLLSDCDNAVVPNYDFSTCDLNTYMCCWPKNMAKEVNDNTDVCYVGDVGYPSDKEGRVHCHGFVWPEDATDKYIHLLAQKVQILDHMDSRGYCGSLPDAPTCGCIEDMPEVSRADCTTYNETDGIEDTFAKCTDNDLSTRYSEVYPDGSMTNLVGDCDNEDETYTTSSSSS